jgi:hypothetical protein
MFLICPINQLRVTPRRHRHHLLLYIRNTAVAHKKQKMGLSVAATINFLTTIFPAALLL